MRTGTVILTFFLAATMLFSSIRISLTYAHYYLDPIGFIEKLCENQDKPEMECNGKCHINKVISEAAGNSEAPMETLELKEVILFLNDVSYHISKPDVRKDFPSGYYSNLYKSKIGLKIDHPPQV